MTKLEEKAAKALNYVQKAEKIMTELGHTKYSLSGMSSAAMRHDLEKEVCQLLDELAKVKKQHDILETALMIIEGYYVHNESTYEDWKAMGQTARNALSRITPI